MPVDSKEMAREIGSTRRWIVLAGVVVAVEGFSLGVLVGFSQPGIEGDEATILTMVTAGVILLCGVVIALIGVLNRASIAAGIGAVSAAALSLLGVLVALAETDEVGGLLLLTGLASLVAGLAGFAVVRQLRTQIN